jgi:hypothetical protein
MDILLAGHYNSGVEIEGRARVYTNDGGVFSDSGNELPAPHAAGDRAGTFSWLDIEGDGDLDYYIAGEYFVPAGNGLVEAQMHLYRNDSPGQNLAPLAPTGITVTQVSENSVMFTWAPGTDDHTPGNALTYDLKLYHDGIPANLPERIPEPGNISSVTQWLFTSLQTGNYSWTLGTVDAAYIGGAVVSGELSLWPVSVEETSENSPGGFILGQNYPNPCNQITTIPYSISREQVVYLNVYNIQGIEVVRLVGEKKPAGTCTISMNIANLPDGVYYYRMQSGNFSQSRKMLISGESKKCD